MALNSMFAVSIVHMARQSTLCRCWELVIDWSINDLTWPAAVNVMGFLLVKPVHPSWNKWHKCSVLSSRQQCYLEGDQLTVETNWKWRRDLCHTAVKRLMDYFTKRKKVKEEWTFSRYFLVQLCQGIWNTNEEKPACRRDLVFEQNVALLSWSSSILEPATS